MENFLDKTNTEIEISMTDVYCIVKNKENNFYWVLNLEDHPNSFLLDKSFQQYLPATNYQAYETMVVIQPTI